MKGDLISREALKEAFDDYIKANPNISGIFELGKFIIDNAPTVEPEITDDDLRACMKESHHLGYELAEIKFKRPQGEWIYGEDDCGQDGWFCSECGFFVPWYYQYYEKDIDFIRDYKACPHCLAEMITYTGKDRDTKGGKEE